MTGWRGVRGGGRGRWMDRRTGPNRFAPFGWGACVCVGGGEGGKCGGAEAGVSDFFLL